MPDENFNTQTHTVHFSIRGEFITNTARKKLYHDNDLAGAMDLILGATVTDQMTEADRVYQALKILNGNLKIAGTYPGDDYGVYDDEPEKPDKLANYFKKTQARIKQQSEKLKSLDEKLECLENTLPSDAKTAIRETLDEFGLDSLFHQENSEPITFMGQQLDVQDTLEHMKTADNKSDYGWLSPTGEFFPGEFGAHVADAMNLAKKFYPSEYNETSTRADDILYRHNWILMHNPMYGTAIPNHAPEARITKKQKDFVYQYYIDREKPGLADRYMREL